MVGFWLIILGIILTLVFSGGVWFLCDNDKEDFNGYIKYIVCLIIGNILMWIGIVLI